MTIGAHDVARAALRRMERDCGTGARWPERPLHVGVQNMGVHLLMRWGSPLSTAGLALRGYVPPVGPVLRDAPWDDLLVTRARCDDGTTLELTMRPRRTSPVRARLSFDGLTPSTPYVLTLPDAVVPVQADSAGASTADVSLPGPVRATLTPAAAAS